MAEKFLYGAAVQGIQSFIFQTNKLREIVGASELVEQICNDEFAKLLGKTGDSNKLRQQLVDDKNCILHAAGNIKYVFDSREACENVFKAFPKIVSEFAPGITASQAVVQFDDSNFSDAVQELEDKLRAQRNKPMRSQTIGLTGIQRSRQTGLPVICRLNDEDKLELIDDATWSKLYYYDSTEQKTRKKTTLTLCRKAFYDDISNSQVAYDIEKITDKNDWIAVIHADGNGLGQVVQKIKEPNKFREFSYQLDCATKNAARGAFNHLLTLKNKYDEYYFEPDKFIPIRPIVLGGDDFTVVCRADFALEYVSEFIKRFEENTSRMELGGLDKLTACAGIAFVKSSYPFYYAYDLAEMLCTQAKNDAKCKNAEKSERNLKNGKIAASCLMFHKVQDSFVEDWESISRRELQPQDNISYNFGPYYLQDDWKESYTTDDGRWTVNQLLEASQKLECVEGNAVKSGLRNWMSLLSDNEQVADQKLARLKSQITNEKLSAFVEKVTDKTNRRGDNVVYPVYNILAINTIKNQITKEDK